MFRSFWESKRPSFRASFCGCLKKSILGEKDGFWTDVNSIYRPNTLLGKTESDLPNPSEVRMFPLRFWRYHLTCGMLRKGLITAHVQSPEGKLSSLYQSRGLWFHTLGTGMWPFRRGRRLYRRNSASPRFIRPTCSVKYQGVTLLRLRHSGIWQIICWWLSDPDFCVLLIFAELCAAFCQTSVLCVRLGFLPNS